MMQKSNITKMLSASNCWIWKSTAITVCGLVCLILPSAARGQSDEVALMQQTTDLIDQLNSASIEDRDAAQEALLTMSPEVLDFIDVPEKNSTSDFIRRLLEIRKHLESKAIQQVTQPSTLNINGTFSVKTAFQKIARQTKNKISLSDRVSPEVAQSKVTLDGNAKTFWSAVNSVMRQSHLEIDLYGGSPGEIVLTSKTQTTADAPTTGRQAPIPAPMNIPQTTTGILAVEINRVDSSRILNAPQLDFTTLNMAIRWEPRVQPISIRLDQSKLKITDHQGNSIKPLRQTSIDATVQTEIPELNFPVNLPLIRRDIGQIKSVTGTLAAILPGRTETFRFRKLGNVESGTSQSKSGATVTFNGVSINEELFGVTVGLSFEGESNELDSHQSWAFDNEAYLVDPADPSQRHEAVAYETVAQNGQSVVVEYYFEVDPDAFDLVYQTPAAIVSVSFDFELNDIPLP